MDDRFFSVDSADFRIALGPCHPSELLPSAMLRLATGAALLRLGMAMPWADSTCEAAPGCAALQLQGAEMRNGR